MAQWTWYDLHAIKLFLENHGWTPVVRWVGGSLPTWIALIVGARYLTRLRRELVERSRRTLVEDAAAAFHRVGLDVADWAEDGLDWETIKTRLEAPMRIAEDA